LLAILHHAGKSVGSHLEVSNFAREAGLSHQTAKKYINVLIQAHLAFKLYGYQYGPAKRYIKAAKLYYGDSGIVTALGLNLSTGQVLENFVISELEKRRKLGFIKSDQFYYYKSTGGAEIDLLFEEDDTLFVVEIKSTKQPSPKDIRNVSDFTKNFKDKKVRPYLLHLGEKYLEIEGVKCIPIYALYRAR
ncbi:MAG: DUF4143 domain-containing protein, partial [Bdellovibrionales bacterium]|nr:DUF4143 domain-containing protein [Bdellovibrionales bacterium]